ncbi:MAG: hypothetical protein GX927_03000, partial [Lentisphaerae bacterium]|nr:hypothetical protein [Lentisphaerota bacterium]
MFASSTTGTKSSTLFNTRLRTSRRRSRGDKHSWFSGKGLNSTGTLNFSRRITVAESKLVSNMDTLSRAAASTINGSTGRLPVTIINRIR